MNCSFQKPDCDSYQILTCCIKRIKKNKKVSFQSLYLEDRIDINIPVYCKGLACWLLFRHTDDTGRAAVRAAKPRAAHTIGPATYPNALTNLRVVQHVS